MTPAVPGGPGPRCWSDIGVWGDHSCPELPRVGHCRNCEVYRQGGLELLERAVPADYLHAWTELIAKGKEAESSATTSYVVFRVGQSWLALRTVVLGEVAPRGVIRSLPHRSSDVLLGLTAVRGELHLCVSLHSLIGDGVLDPSAPTVRFLLVRDHNGDWVFPVDEVDGIHDVVDAAVEPLPATLAHVSAVYTRGIAQCGDRPVGLIDERLVFSALGRRIA